LPFRDSRCLASRNPYLPAAGVALDVDGIELDEQLLTAWHVRVERARSQLGWPAAATHACVGEPTTLAFEAPARFLATAMEANEWAWCAALVERDPLHWSVLRDSLRQGACAVTASGLALPPPEIDDTAALARFARLASALR
jgi:hypothetical protein